MSNILLMTEDLIQKSELERRVIYSTLTPAVRLAGLFNLPLKEMKQWLAVAYLHEMKRKGLTQQECAERMDVSRRTVIDLSKRLKENFFSPEHAGLARRILFMLWAEPMNEGRLVQALADEFDEDEIRHAISELRSNERIDAKETKTSMIYSLSNRAFRLYRDNWIARVDALNNQLSQLTDTVFSRFFTDDKRGFVRTVGLSIRKEDAAQLEAFYRDVVFPKLQTLDAAAEDADQTELYEFSISWVPKDYIFRFSEEQNES